MAEKMTKVKIEGVNSLTLAGEVVKAGKDGFFNLTDAQVEAALPFTRKPVRIQNSMQGYRVPKPNNMKPVAVATPIAKIVAPPVIVPQADVEAPAPVAPGRKAKKG